jgi:SAM-dependent methyltransferase
MRAAVHFSHTFLNIHHSSKLAHKSDDPSFKIYIMEQVTHLYAYCQTLYPHIIGSEFLGDKVKLGTTDERGIRNEDARCLSFPNNALDAILSFEILEHVPDFQRVFIECLRTLKPGGVLLFTAPFTLESPNNTIRAEVNCDGSLTHHLPEEYHTDPNNDKGVLCYHYFGWEVLHNLRALGFRDAFVNTFWSIDLGYFTCQVQVVAIK